MALWRAAGRALAGIIALGLGAGLAAAQTQYPTRPITVIVPFAAGGPTDVIARIVGEHMSRTLGQQFVIENVVGAGGTTASARAMRAAADGYTLVMGNMGTHAAAVGLYPKLAYDPRTDFEPVGLAGSTPVLILARKDLPPKDLGDFITYVKANGGTLNNAHAGVGSVSFTACLLLNSLLGVSPALIPFNGTGPALNNLVAGQVDYLCDQMVNAVPQVQAGTVKAYAVASPERNPVLPDVPTTTEAGLPQFQASAFSALFAPKDTPAEIVDKLNGALAKALDNEGVRKRLIDLGSDLPSGVARSRQALRDLVKAEVDKWTPIIKAAGVAAN